MYVGKIWGLEWSLVLPLHGPFALNLHAVYSETWTTLLVCRAVLTECHRLVTSASKVFSYSSGVQQSQIWLLAGLAGWFLLRPRSVTLRCPTSTCICPWSSSEHISVLTSSSYKDTSHSRLGSTLKASLWLNYPLYSPYLLIWLHSEVLGIKTSTDKHKGTNSAHKNH